LLKEHFVEGGKAMKKAILSPLVFCIICFLSSDLSFAKPIMTEKVAKAAKTFLVVRYPTSDPNSVRTLTKKGRSALGVKDVFPLIVNEILVGYIADLEPTGFILFSSDDEIPPVKIYSDTGSFYCLPYGLKKVLELELLEDNDLLKSDKQKDKLKLKKYQDLWRFLSSEEEDDGYQTSVSNTAILNTAWDQDDPYNLYCPIASGGPDGRAWAGCTATALAQVLRHHNYPPAISMDHSYTDSKGSCQGTHLISDAGIGAYSWSDMPFSISVTSPSAQQQAVAQLIYHCAVALESDFEADGTTAFPSDIDDVLSTFFDYTSDNYVSKSNYSNTTWYNKIAGDIDDNQPIFYAMWESDGSHGHAVVCDGYRNGNEIHLDLGWSGSWTAWYNMDSVSASGYTWTKHGAVFNILPDVQEHPPTLTNYGFNPTPPIYPHTEIDFYVYYNDPEQYPPQVIEVVIDGVEHSMNQESGAKYTYTSTISELGEHSYYFYAEDKGGLSDQTVPQFFNVISYNPGSFEVLKEYLIDDSQDISTLNNNDGFIQSGERVWVSPQIKYSDSATGIATHIDVSLISEDSCVEEVFSPENYPDMDPGDTSYPKAGEHFRVEVGKHCSGLFYLDTDIEWEGLDGVDQYEHIDNALSLDIQPEAWINIMPDEYDFGAVKQRPEDDVVLTLKIQNVGTEILNISNIQTSHGDTEVSQTIFSINPGESSDVTVTVHVSTLDGSITRDVYVIHDGRAKKDEDEHLVITGLVSNTPLSFEIPTVNRPFEPDISGSRIVWHEDRDGDANSDILLYDANTGKQLLMPSSQYQQGDSFISGDIVVWGSGYLSDQRMVYGYDLSTGNEFPVMTDPKRITIYGVSGNKIAIAKEYDRFLRKPDSTTYRVAYNLIVYEYVGNGQCDQIYTTGWTPGSGTQTRQTVTYSSSGCDFNEDMLVYENLEIVWDGDSFEYQTTGVSKIDYALGESSPTLLGCPTSVYRLAAGPHSFVYSERDSVSGDDLIYKWPGCTQVTPIIDVDYGDDSLAFNGSYIVYDKYDTHFLYYWNMNEGREYLINNNPGYHYDARFDGNGLVWDYRDNSDIHHILFTFINQSDISVSSSNISFSNDNPKEGTTIDISVRIQNSTDYDVTGDVTVKLFDGDPDSTGIQLGNVYVIFGGMTAQSEASHTFTAIPVGIEGDHEIYAQVLVGVFDVYTNNKASKTLRVEDSNEPPDITNVWVTEYNGDGDGLVESDENIFIQWQAIPQSPLIIADTYCQIADVNYVGEGSYHVILDPFEEGDYSFTIYAEDNDVSPGSSTYEGNFSVAIASIEGDTNNDGIVDFNDVAKVTSQWLNDNCSNETRWCHGADLDHSTNVNLIDFSIIAANWRQELFIAFFNEPLDIDPGWSTEGEWQFGVPAGLGGGPITGNPDPISGYTGMNVYGVNLNGDYRTLAGGPYNLTTASIDCSGYHNVYLKFARWLNSDYAPYVTNKVEVSNDNVIWNTVWQSSSISPMKDSDWQLIEYAISGYADNQPTVYIRWNYQTDGSAYPYSGWNIDDIELWGNSG
jgi:hypothetical protein